MSRDEQPVDDATTEALADAVLAIGRSLRVLALTSADASLPLSLAGVLAALATRGECRQSELAADLHLTPSSMSRQISELVASGYVLRTTDPADKRALLIRVSSRGTEILRRTTERRSERLRAMCADWSQQDALTAVASLRHLNETFVASIREAAPRYSSRASGEPPSPPEAGR
ncbi:MarR family winged helix-turn-helix transcriptional regulator [Nocardia sp. NPDC003963]